MEQERRFICKSVNPLRKTPPKDCVRDKTITFDTFGNSLFFFWDSRPYAQDYVKEVLPTLIHPPLTKEQILSLYQNNLNGGWLEFDFTTNTLFFCSLKKTKV